MNVCKWIIIKHKNQKEVTHSKIEQKYNHSQTTELRFKVTFPYCFTSQVVYLALYFKSQYAERTCLSPQFSNHAQNTAYWKF